MAYQRLSTEEKERRKKELLDKVENIIDNFQRSPADLIEYFKFNSKFYQYSKNNNALIYQQNPYAQYCGSFKAFKDMGYSIKKGEHGMKILVPYISKYFYHDTAKEWKKVSEATAEQKLKIKNGEIEIKQYTSFGVGTVFDISQTDCPVEEYPKFFGFGHASKSHRELFNAVKYYAEGKGIPVEIIDLKSITLSGEYNAADNSIVLSDKLNDDRLLSVMTHELSHALLHNSDITENENKHIMQIEFEADAMSLLLRERLGISDIEDARQAHLQTSFKRYMEWSEENTSEQYCPTLSEILDNINDAYSKIAEDFDNSIKHYFELHPSIEQSVSTTNNFAKTIDDFINGRLNPTDQIFVCNTPDVMKICGANDLDVIIYQNTIKKILSNDFSEFEHPHNLPPEKLKQLPIQLQKPIMVFKGSHQGSIVLVTDLFNNNFEQIIISCELNSTNKRHEVNRITSMYGKENIANYLNSQIKKDNLIGCQKNIAKQMLLSVGLCLPNEETFIDYTDIISNFDKNVNHNNLINEEKIMEDKIYAPETIIFIEDQKVFDDLTTNPDVRYHFYNCTFDDIHFSDNVVIGQLERCRFNRCTFENFDAESIKFNGSVLTDCSIINSNFKSCNFENVGLYQSQISKSDLTNANFATANMKRTRFDENNLSAVKFHGATLNGVIITEPTINKPIEGLFTENITWDGATYEEIETLRKNIFSRLKLEPVTFAQKVEAVERSLEPLSELKNGNTEPISKQTIVVNCFAGPGAGKTTCAWEIASELKKHGIEAEYVGEYAKELVWDGNTELLDGSLQSQQRLYDVQNHRVQRLLGKVDVVVTDSPAIIGAMYLKQPNAEFENKIIKDFKLQHNFNLFINRGNSFQQTGRIHNLEESKAIDANIKAFLEKYEIYYGTYEHSTINKVVNNIETHIKKANDNLYSDRIIKTTEIYNADELEKLYNISLKLNENNLHPVDVLKDVKQIDFYSFVCNIHDSRLTKDLLWKIYQNDMQITAIYPSENGYILKSIDQDFKIQQFSDIVYTAEEDALSAVYSNNQIAKLTEPRIMESCSAYKDLSILSEADNLKYPYIQICWTDSEHIKDSECISLKAAQEKFNCANHDAGDTVCNTSFSLHLNDDIIYNLKYSHTLQGQKIIEFIKSHLQEAQTDQSLNKALATLNSYISSQTAYQEQLNPQSNQVLDSFDATEYSL